MLKYETYDFRTFKVYSEHVVAPEDVDYVVAIMNLEHPQLGAFTAGYSSVVARWSISKSDNETLRDVIRRAEEHAAKIDAVIKDELRLVQRIKVWEAVRAAREG